MFRAAFASRIPVILKGPTGCGKTRFVEHMAHALGLPLVTVSCHEDLTASDLVGRYLLRDDETVWQDGPLTLAVRYGGICYLDEIVEARKDTTVVIHSLTDDRRMLYIDKTGEVVRAHAGLHDGAQLQPRLPEHRQGPQAVHQAALREPRIRPSACGDRDRDRAHARRAWTPTRAAGSRRWARASGSSRASGWKKG